MRTLHTALMGTLMVGLAALALGTIHPSMGIAEAQHGHGAATQHAEIQDAAAHMEHVATLLEFTDEQREKLAEPINAAFAAMQEMHRLHGVIAESLTEEQREKLSGMMHQAMGGAMDHDGAHEHGSMHEHDGAHQDGPHQEGELHTHGTLH